MTLESFSMAVEAQGLRAVRCREDHWQIVGGKYIVNFYPSAKNGPTMYVNGMTAKAPKCTSIGDAIRAAQHGYQTFARVVRKSQYRGVKRRLLKRDARCHWCRIDLTAETATIDHRIPLSSGGSNGTDNLVLACRACNQDKGGKMPHNFVIVGDPKGKP